MKLCFTSSLTRLFLSRCGSLGRGLLVPVCLAWNPAMAAESVPTVERDVAYLAPDRTEKLDVWLPPAALTGPHPVVLLIHGGGWGGGDKAQKDYSALASTLAGHGLAVFSINYRLNEVEKGPDGINRHLKPAWPQNYQDCEAALAWIRREGSARYPIDPARIAVMGGSAGGQLAMLLGARHADEIRAIVCLYGFGRIEGRWVSAFAGTTPEETAARVKAASPVNHFTAQTPPLFLAHGTADKTLSVDHARWLVRELQAREMRYVYVEIAGGPHGFFLDPPLLDLRPSLFAFLDRQLVGAR